MDRPQPTEKVRRCRAFGRPAARAPRSAMWPNRQLPERSLAASLSPSRLKKRHDTGLGWEFGSGSRCPLWVDTVEKVVSDPPKRNNRTRTARYLNRNCVRAAILNQCCAFRAAKSFFNSIGQKQTFALHQPMSALPPCVDGSELARTFLNVRPEAEET